MSEPAQFPPDITLAVDGDGVIRTAISAESLADELVDQWEGMRWSDTFAPDAAEQVSEAVRSVQREGESSCFTVSQRLPSGRELKLEYTTVKLAEQAGFVAIGKSVQEIVQLRTRLARVQREREQDYWKLREIETRYRGLLEASPESVVLVRVDNLRVVEANVAATKSLGLVPGAEFLPDLSEPDRNALGRLLEAARLNGRAPSIVLHLSDSRVSSLRAAMLTSEAGAFYLLQMTPLEDAGAGSPAEDSASYSLENFVWRLPDGFTVLDREGVVRYANLTFVDLVHAGIEGAVIGKNAKIWFNKPGTGLKVILDLVQRHGVVRSLRTTLETGLGMISEIEISAVGDQVDRPNFFGLIVRDVASHPRSRGVDSTFAFLERSIAGGSLETVVRSSVEAIERKRLVDSLTETGGNRTQAAKLLGISRQSLYSKLRKYNLPPA